MATPRLRCSPRRPRTSREAPTPLPVPAPCESPTDGLLADELMSVQEQARLGEYLTPRRGFGGQWVWPIDELFGGAP